MALRVFLKNKKCKHYWVNVKNVRWVYIKGLSVSGEYVPESRGEDEHIHCLNCGYFSSLGVEVN